MRKAVFVALLMVLSLNTVSFAQQQHTNEARGFSANGVYASNDIDHINLFNGNLTLKVPISNKFQVGGQLSYELTLFYNSNFWTTEEVCQEEGVNYAYGLFTTWATCPTESSGYDQCHLDPFINEGGTQAPQMGLARGGANDSWCWPYTFPNPDMNAGLGWGMTLGRLYYPQVDELTIEEIDGVRFTTQKGYIVYQSPDGSEHTFYFTLHADDQEDPGDTGSVTGQKVLYTRDGTYLRMKRDVLKDGITYPYVIQFPNGESHYFRNFQSGGYPGPSGELKVVLIEDQFSNRVQINYLDDSSEGSWGQQIVNGQQLQVDSDTFPDNVWVITDSVGRSHKVYLERKADADFHTVVRRVTLESFNGLKSNYDFTYEVQPIDHGKPNPPSTVFPTLKRVLNVPYLTAVKLPDNSQYSMPYASSYYTAPRGTTEAVFNGGGRIKRVQLPTGGVLEWSYYVAGEPYGQYMYRYAPISSARHYNRLSIGVRRRKLLQLDANGNVTKESIWKYDPQLFGLDGTCPIGSVGPSCSPSHLVNRVTTPENDVTLHYFSVYPHPLWNESGRGLSEQHVADYGLPLTKAPGYAPPDVNNKPLFLSMQVLDKSGSPSRSVYVRYETDKFTKSDGFGNVVETNARLVASRTVYHDDGDRFDEVQYSKFDGLGNYRQVDRYSNLRYVSTIDRTTVFTNYTKGGWYEIDPTQNAPVSGTYFNQIPPGSPWVLGNYSEITRIDATSQTRVREDYQFNDAGQLKRKRTRKNISDVTNPDAVNVPATSSQDVVVTYDYDTRGNLITERTYGGDNQTGLGTGEQLGTLPLPTNSEFTITHTYQPCGGNPLGVVKTSTYANGLAIVDNDIDCSTGNIKVMRDTAGVATTYTYDALGRITEIKRQQGHHTSINYNPLTPGTTSRSASVEVRHRGNPNAPNIAERNVLLGEEEYRYDPLGRLTLEKVRLPDNTFSLRFTSYNAMGWVTDVSEWLNATLYNQQPCDQNNPNEECHKKTSYENFDEFGRPRHIRMADGKEVTRFYSGVRQIQTNFNVGTTLSSTGEVNEEAAQRWERYDHLGRLFQIVEQSSPDAAIEQTAQTARTTYAYNALDALAWTCTGDGKVTTQCRSFSYDGMGNLRTEGHPERSWSQYGSYDTMGHVGQSFDGLHTLSYKYDTAGRPIKIEELTARSATPRPIKDYSYYSANNDPAGGVFARGKLATATRHNHVRNPYETPQNVAAAANGATTVASSTHSSGYGAQYAIDGRRSGSQWGVNGGWNDGTQNVWPDWIEVRFNGPKSISQVNVFSVQDNFTNPVEPTESQTFSLYGLADFQVQYWNNSTSSWVTLPNGQITNNNLVWKKITFDTVTTDKIRVYVTRGLNLWSRVTEIEAYEFRASNPIIYDVAVSEQYTYSELDGRPSKRVTSTNVANGPVFEQTFNYQQLGYLASQTYPECKNTTCVNSGAQRPLNVKYAYTNGMLTSVGTAANSLKYAKSITYNQNRTLNTVLHGNNLYDVEVMDPRNMARPNRIYTSTAVTGGIIQWDSDIYRYDGAGNVKKIGENWYLYDKVSRLREGTALLGADPAKRLKQQYDYDTYGNQKTIRTYNNVTSTGADIKETYQTNVSSATNRTLLNYDQAGNAIGLNGSPPPPPIYIYDALNMIVNAPWDATNIYGPGLTYLYGPNDERFWIINTRGNSINSDNEETFTLRGLGNEVLREYRVVGGNADGNWMWDKDYIYRDGKLLAAETSNGVRHYHVDHLGSPRLVTDANGVPYQRLIALPFGETGGVYSNGEPWSLYYAAEPLSRLQFTGHEKDSDAFGLNYMHARYYLERGARFLSVDPVRRVKALARPQLWNRYAYGMNNPLKLIDPDGKDPIRIYSNDTNARSLLIRTAMRPEGRKVLTELAQQNGSILVKDEMVPNRPGFVRMANTRARINVDANNQVTTVDLTISIDTQDVRYKHTTDQSGLQTANHEFKHGRTWSIKAQDIVDGKTDIDKEDHTPSNEGGAAGQFGNKVIEEHPDKTWDEAIDWLDQNHIWQIIPPP